MTEFRDYRKDPVKVRELIKELELEDPNNPVQFGQGHFTFYRVKNRSGVVQIEFNEVEGQDYQVFREQVDSGASSVAPTPPPTSYASVNQVAGAMHSILQGKYSLGSGAATQESLIRSLASAIAKVAEKVDELDRT